METLIWKSLVKKRFETLLACILIPAISGAWLCLKKGAIGAAIAMSMIMAVIGLFAFTILTTRDWLIYCIALRKQRQESTKRLEWMKLALYLFVFPLTLFGAVLAFVMVMY